MIKPIPLIVLAPILAMIVFTKLCCGQTATFGDKNPTDEAEKRFQLHAREQAEAYEIRVDAPAGRKLVLQPEPILRWSNPVPEKQMHGDVYLWADDGRPAAVLCLFEMKEDGISREYLEFTSLVEGSLVTT